MRIVFKLFVAILILVSCNQSSSLSKEKQLKSYESNRVKHYSLKDIKLENISLELVNKIISKNGFDTDFAKGYFSINQDDFDDILMIEDVMFMDSINNNIYMIYRYPTSKFENYFLSLNIISKKIDRVYLLKNINKVQYLKTNDFAIIKLDESEKTSDSIVLSRDQLIEISSKIKLIEW